MKRNLNALLALLAIVSMASLACGPAPDVKHFPEPGLVRVDHETLERISKQSAYWFAQLGRQSALTV